MRKLILALAFATIATGVSAQGIMSPSNGQVKGDNPSNYPAVQTPIMQKSVTTPSAEAKTKYVSTWYNYQKSLDEVFGQVTTYGPYLFRDTNVVWLGSDNGTFNKLDTFVWNSVGAAFDPTADIFTDDLDTATQKLPGTSLKPKTPFTLDSVGIFYNYKRGTDVVNGTPVVDTLIVQLFNTDMLKTYFFHAENNKLDTTGRFVTVPYNIETGLATKATQKLVILLTGDDVTPEDDNFELKTFAANFKSNGGPVAAVFTYRSGQEYNDYDTLTSNLSEPVITNPVNAFRFIMGYDANTIDLMTFNNGMVVQHQQRGNPNWVVGSSEKAQYMPGSSFKSYFYPQIFFHITATYDDGVGIKEMSNIAENVKVYPNPIKGNGVVDFKLTNSDNVTITIKDITGKVISTENKGNLSAGRHQLSINTAQLKSGLYFCTLDANSGSKTIKIMVTE